MRKISSLIVVLLWSGVLVGSALGQTHAASAKARWYMKQDATQCAPYNPAEVIAWLHREHRWYASKDITNENGQVIETAIALNDDGNLIQVVFHRGKARCELALREDILRDEEELEKYR